jgi:hypothetical protein
MRSATSARNEAVALLIRLRRLLRTATPGANRHREILAMIRFVMSIMLIAAARTLTAEEQLRECHDAGDFATKTLDKIDSQSGQPSSRQASANGTNTAGSSARAENARVVKVGSHSTMSRPAAFASAVRPARNNAAAKTPRAGPK